MAAQTRNGDIWVHGQYAYVGNWLDPCTGNGVRVVNVADPRRPRLVGTLAARAGTWAEDPVVRRVSTAHFTGDLLAVGIMRCGTSSNLDRQTFGAQLWDVTDPRNPRHLSSIPLAFGRLLSGARELDVVQRGGRVYVLAPMAFTSSEWFDKPPAGDVRIIDVTDPRDPRVVGQWGARAHGLSRGPYFGQGSFGARMAFMVRASVDGRKAHVAYWDLGVVTLDITDVTNPRLLTRTRYGQFDEGNAHGVSAYDGRARQFLLQNDDDLDPRSPTMIFHGGNRVGVANESPFAAALWLRPAHSITTRVVRAAGQGCRAGDYPREARDAIVW